MNYIKHYDLLIKKCKPRGTDKTLVDGYFELHHILPRCMGGLDEDTNLVLLTAKEHYIAHLLLSKANPSHVGLGMAIRMLVTFTKREFTEYNSYLYEKLRLKLNEQSKRSGSLSFKDFTGQRFGQLLVIGLAGWRQRKRDGCHESRWLCECSCGNMKEVAGKNLQQGSTKSCGCLVKETHPRQGKPATGEYKSGATTWDLTGESRPWKSHHIMKYQHNLDKWNLASYYHSLWESAGGKGISHYILWKVYSHTHNDSTVAVNYFNLMCGMFNDGWVPSCDQEWLTFSSSI